MLRHSLTAVHLNTVGSAFALRVVHTMSGRTGDGHTGIGFAVANVVGGTGRDAGVGIATGFAAAASIGTIHQNVGAATTLVFVAGTMDHVAFQLSHHKTLLSVPLLGCFEDEFQAFPLRGRWHGVSRDG